MIISNLSNYISFMVYVVGGGIILILAGAIWALKQIKNELKDDFVTKDECNDCTQKIKENFYKNVDAKYEKLHNEIIQNREERLRDMRVISDSTIEIKTKLDLLLNGMIKHEQS